MSESDEIEDIEYSGGAVQKVTEYGLGAREIDAMYVTQSGTTTAVYPIFDSHGSMMSTLTKLGAGGYVPANLRTFDAWGNIRVGAPTGDPKGRYCASLGHKQDDESVLIYMRARYYEPGSGRFVSEDPAAQGRNWFTYCSGDPISFSDKTGLYGDPLFGVVEGMEIEVADSESVIGAGGGAMCQLLNAVASITLREVSALAGAGAAAGQTFVTQVGQFACKYQVGGDTGIGAFAIKTQITDGAGKTVFWGMFAGNDAGIYNLHIKFIDVDYWMGILSGKF